jgi:predicted adenylyl cyclase CyaB
LAEELHDTGSPERIDQIDTFFHGVKGRLKLRTFADGSGELIQYERASTVDPRESAYLRYPVADPPRLLELLSRALGVRGVLRKRRWLYLAGRTRIHLDQVEGLGEFIELELVLDGDETVDQGVPRVRELMRRLEIEDRDSIDVAYIDLLEAGAG